jgi:hypothetical protein
MTGSAQSTPRLRARLKKSALGLADRIAGRGGALDGVLPRLRPFLEWRPDSGKPRGSAALIPDFAGRRGATGNGPIFATGRFRAGTTLLWNLFRNAGGTTAYYEPFNPRRWFDPATRGDTADPSHRGVSRYWDEYRELADLAPLFRARWHERNLFMDESSRDAAMERYVRALVARAPQRAVLQFNRVDLRLPWFRARFPGATIVHVLRNPRDQWCSTLPLSDLDPARTAAAVFADHDGFYLRHWVEQLAGKFPFLAAGYAAHPYRAHYMLWRLSQAFGLAYADYSLTFEDLVRRPHAALAALFAATELDAAAIPRLAALIEAPRLGRWTEWASDEWFAAHEDDAERRLTLLADAGGAGRRP